MILACNFTSTIVIAFNLGINQMGWFFEWGNIYREHREVLDHTFKQEKILCFTHELTDILMRKNFCCCYKTKPQENIIYYIDKKYFQ